MLLCFSSVVGLLAQSSALANASDVVASDQSVYYVLGCKHQGWQGYFALDNWYQTTSSGDGGVDVTEAPNALVAEGASSARLVVQTGSSPNYVFRITVPADGYLYFRLKKVGSFLSPHISSTDTDLYLLINGQRAPLETLPNGSYYSPFLRAGTTFGIAFQGPGNRYHWEDISFYSNCSGVWVTPSDKSNGWRPARVRPIDRPRLNQIYFSYDRPEEWPTLDLDGDMLTIGDQQVLSETAPGPFELSFRDDTTTNSGQYWVQRIFQIKEPCSGNKLEVKRWWAPLPIIPPPPEQ
ncbi:MAG: hypothetical protein AAF433_03025 [Bacteroidota bacterium]